MKNLVTKFMDIWHPLMVLQAVHDQSPLDARSGLSVHNGPKSRAHNSCRLNLFALCLLLAGNAAVAAPVAQTPLFLTTAVPPNIMLMIDNSGSMNTNVVPKDTPYDAAITYPKGASCSVFMPDTHTEQVTSTVTDPTQLGSIVTRTDSSTSANSTTKCRNRYPINTLLNSSTTFPNATTRVVTERWRTADVANYSSGVCSYKTQDRIITIRTIISDVVRDTIYGTAIPADFYGNYEIVDGDINVTGSKCFDRTVLYKTSLTVDSGVDVNNKTQLANWLNWYYSNKIEIQLGTAKRLDIAKRSAKSLVDNLTEDTRLGFSTFNTHDDTDGGMIWESIDALTATKKEHIKNRIDAANPDTWTPLSETIADIGRYFATGNDHVTLRAGTASASSQLTSDVLPSQLVNDTTWRTLAADEPTFSGAPIEYSCQKNFAVIVTDGQPTMDRQISTNTFLSDYDKDCTKADGTYNTTICDTYDRKKDRTYVSGSDASDYFDDVTAALFEMDLRPDLRRPSEAANAKNNLITHVIGFADDQINPNVAGVNPLPKNAAIKGGGDFIYAGNQAELSASLISTFRSINARNSSSSSVAANSTQFQTDALLFQALFNSTDWSGDIKTYNLTTEDTNHNGILDEEDANHNGVLDTGEDRNGNGLLDHEDLNGNGKIDAGGIGSVRWLASTRMPSPSARKIYTYNAVDNKGIEFYWDSLNDAQRAVIDPSVNTKGRTDSKVFNFLRGDRSNEKTLLRERSSILGDIVNSDPLFVAGQDLGYTALPGVEGTSYSAHKSKKLTNSQILYAGANDGMLHGFNVTVGSANEGKESFAYVPNAVISTDFAKLSQKNYSHRYYVDGSPQFGDAYYGDTWHTVLVGTMGAGSTTVVGDSSGTGGKGIFALDITDPDSFNEEDVLWEFTNRHDGDLGYTIPSASIVRMNNGKWAVLMANGYQSTAGKAVLFILDAETGAIIRKIEAGSAGANGLSTPLPVDVDNDKNIDYIYAGDLKGNMWKFDVTDKTNVSNWGVAYSNSPLFTAMDDLGNLQPITSRPAIADAKATDQSGRGMMIYFGTGKYCEDTDQNVLANAPVQSFYGIWDQCDDKSNLSCLGVVSSRSQLQKQTITHEITTTLPDSSALQVRRTTQCQVGYGATTPDSTEVECTKETQRRGWYLDLLQPPSPGTHQGERVVSTPIVRNDTVIFVSAIPTNITCEPGGTGWLMELNLDGARFAGSPIDINDDSKIDEHDLITFADGTTSAASGVGSTVGIIKTPAVINCEKGLDCKYLSGSSGGLMHKKEKAPSDCEGAACDEGGGASHNLRRSWRQLR